MYLSIWIVYDAFLNEMIKRQLAQDGFATLLMQCAIVYDKVLRSLISQYPLFDSRSTLFCAGCKESVDVNNIK